MATTQATLSAEPRSVTGKGAARELRRKGRIPAVIYGHHREPEALDVDAIRRRGSSRPSAPPRPWSTSPSPIARRSRPDPRDPAEIQCGGRRDPSSTCTRSAPTKITVEVPVHLTGIPTASATAAACSTTAAQARIRVFPKDLPDHIRDRRHAAHHRSWCVRARRHRAQRGNPERLSRSAPSCRRAPRPPRFPVAAAEIAEPELIRKPKAEEEGEAEE